MEDMLTWVRTLLPTVLAPILALIVGWFAGKYRDHASDVRRIEDKQDANNEATTCLVRKTLIDFYDLYVRHGAPMTIERIHEITELYQAYKRLGGDGVVDKMHDELSKLPIVVVNKQEVPIGKEQS